MGRTDTNFGPTEGSSEATMQAGCHISRPRFLDSSRELLLLRGLSSGACRGPHSRYGLSHTRATLQSHRHYSGMGWGNERLKI
jgi:hypothetical protein